VLGQYFPLETVTVPVADPLGRPLEASYQRAGDTAYVELAAASGIVLLAEAERDAMVTTTLGTGQLIAHALDEGVRELYLFIGGSATNDGGTGIAHALGYRFFDAVGSELAPVGVSLRQLHRIDASRVHPDLPSLAVKVVCDVDNPFYGPRGAAYTYGPQKGASATEVEILDQGLRQLAGCLTAAGYPDVSQLAGAGAAGGVGGGAVALLGGELVSGTDTFLTISKLEAQMKTADVVLTGEGKLDTQTQQGKLISGVCALAHTHAKPVIGVCGAAEAGVADALGLARLYTVMDRSASVADAMETAYVKLVAIGAEVEW
jgi:glycerate kinase